MNVQAVATKDVSTRAGAHARRLCGGHVSEKIARFLAIRPPLTYHLADIDPDGNVEFRTSDRSEIWINGGYFIFRREIFDYLKEGEELVLEPFTRLIAEGQLMAYEQQGFWMDMLRDRQILEDMVEQGNVPWRTQPEGAVPPAPAPARKRQTV